MLNEIIKHLDSSDALYDFADAVVAVRLKMTRDMYEDEIQRLNSMGSLSKVQQEDFDILTADVEALTRVLGFYGYDDEDGRKYWYLNDERLTEEEFNKRMAPAVEMTMAQISEALGKNVKVVK